jgi:hypothetical protein
MLQLSNNISLIEDFIDFIQLKEMNLIILLKKSYLLNFSLVNNLDGIELLRLNVQSSVDSSVKTFSNNSHEFKISTCGSPALLNLGLLR